MASLLDKLERQFIQWTIPGLIRYLAILFVGVFLLTAVKPEFAATLDFNYAKIQDGEYWRLLTFIFAPQIGSFSTAFAVIFLIFGTMLMFAFSDGLEQQWGVFRTNLFVYWGIASTLAANLIYAIAFETHFPMSGIYLGVSILFAFATYNPRFPLMLMLVIPCPIWVIAALAALPMLYNAIMYPFHGMFVALCISNYLIIAIPMLLTSSVRKTGNHQRRKRFTRQFSNKQEAFHTCHACGANDITHPDKEFRVGKDGHDYCSDHLPE
ncbi:hypothetical protein [Rubritalea tangerina]|uniref:Peptidase S54 rhomboid domain-containing protein n=1 Tax=Rubritalea tangerina TaxID=430798 RepID=A0ABW4Z759_9BACT